MKIYFIEYEMIKKIFIMILILLVIGFFILLPLILNEGSKETFNNNDIFYKGNTNEKIIAFACNVDWGNEYIKPMLNILDKYNIKISFFCYRKVGKK